MGRCDIASFFMVNMSYIKILSSLKHKKYRDLHGKYIIEGEKCILEAIESGVPVERVLCVDGGSRAARTADDRGIEVMPVDYSVIERISDTKTPPKDIACVLKRDDAVPANGSFYVALDSVNDPKNLGGIIRTADAFNAAGVFLSEGCADHYGPKAQRAAMGSTFHIPVERCRCGLLETLAGLKRDGVSIIVSSLDGGEERPAFTGPVCLVIGNEARGVSEDVAAMADVLFKIKIPGRAESLNAGVAAGIMMYVLTQP